MFGRLAFSIVCLLFPYVSYGAVLINEIAWMGTAANANDEWIELHNTGSETVSLDGWILDDGASLSIQLAGAIGAGEYALLERTDDDTVSSKTALLIYTGALSNDGRTLTLRHVDTSIEDRVVCDTGWIECGGNNDTKDTAQRTSTGWVTGVPTPGGSNTSLDAGNTEEETSNESLETDETEESSLVSTHVTRSSTAQLKIPPVLSVGIDAPIIAYVNQPINFLGVPSGLGKAILSSLTYSWNFGDGNVTEGKEIQHQYAYPGTYIAVLNAVYATYKDTARKTITVLPVTITVTRVDANGIRIENTSDKEIDIGGFTLTGTSSFTFPDNTVILPQSSIVLSAKKVGNISEGTVLILRDRARTEVARDPRVYVPKIEGIFEYSVPLHVDSETIQPSEDDTENETITVDNADATVTNTIPVYAEQSAYVGGTPDHTLWYPYAGLAGIIGIGIVFLYIRRNESFQDVIDTHSKPL
jgi:hypothetical protein